MAENYIEEYEGIRNRVTSLCVDDMERQRVKDEFVLFEERGWEKYIVLLTRILNLINSETKEGMHFSEKGGSAMDSFALRLLCAPEFNCRGMLGKKRDKAILFNDALRLNLEIGYLPFLLRILAEERSYKMLVSSVDDCRKGLGLHMKEFNPSNGELCPPKGRIIVISKEPLTEEEEKLILEEKGESTADETDKLRRFLLIKLTTSSDKFRF